MTLSVVIAFSHATTATPAVTAPAKGCTETVRSRALGTVLLSPFPYFLIDPVSRLRLSLRRRVTKLRLSMVFASITIPNTHRYGRSRSTSCFLWTVNLSHVTERDPMALLLAVSSPARCRRPPTVRHGRERGANLGTDPWGIVRCRSEV